MRFIVIRDDADRDTLDAAIITLRAKQSRAVIASTADEIGADIDELLDRRGALTS